MLIISPFDLCPRCGSKDIAGPLKAFSSGFGQMPGNLQVRISFWKSATLLAYSCVACGYTELYADAKGLENLQNAFKKASKLRMDE